MKLELGLPTSLGEIINIKWHLDLIKNQYSEIKLNFDKSLWNTCLHTEAHDWKYKEALWNKYLDDIGALLFSEYPYVLDRAGSFFMYDMGRLAKKLNLTPTKAEMGHLLCAGVPLNLVEEYIVITTKVGNIDKYIFLQKSFQLWRTLKALALKYKIVVLGERVVEMRKEYGSGSNIYSIYDQIIANLPKDRILDLTVPALGETVADLKDTRQDCLIMRDAKFVITFGVRGNFCLSTSVANMAIGFRADNLEFTDKIYNNKTYPNAVITKDWTHFIRTLESYL